MADLEHALCPICDIDTGETVVDGESGKVIQCSECGLVYASDRVSKEYLSELQSGYTPSSFFSADKYPFAERIKQAHSDLEFAESYIDTGIMFDVCGGSGAFADAAQQRGWSVSGNDLSVICGILARRLFGINFLGAELGDLTFDAEVVSMFTMMNSIEHLREPIKELGIMHDALVDGGILLIRTPELFSWQVKEKPQLPHHIYNYNKKTITMLLEKCGFTMLKYRGMEQTMLVIGSKKWVK